MDALRQRVVLRARTALARDRATFMDAMHGLADATREAEEAAAKLAISREVRGGLLARGREMGNRMIENRQVLWEIDRNPRERFDQPFYAAVPAPAPEPALPAGPTLELDAKEARIERIATHAAIRYFKMRREEADDWWERWKLRLGLDFPTYIADEIAQRAERIRENAR
jgi:hypothetical protein